MKALCINTISCALTTTSTLLSYACHCFWSLVLLQKVHSKERWRPLNYTNIKSFIQKE